MSNNSKSRNKESFIRIGNEQFLTADLDIFGLDCVGNDQSGCGRSGADFHSPVGDDAKHTGVLFHKMDVLSAQFLPVTAQDGNGVIGGKGAVALQNDTAHIRTGETAAFDLV